MNKEEYASNSNKSKAAEQQKAIEERRKVEKIVQGPVKVKKKSGLRKLTDTFISEDVSDVKTYVVKDVIVPNVKKLIWEMFTGGLDIALNGKNGSSYRNTKSNASRVSFRDYSNDYNRSRQGSENSSRNRGGYSCDDIIFGSRGEAEEVLSQMIEQLAEYNGTPVAVGDLYALVGLNHNPTDYKYGWTDLGNAYVERCRDGYMLKLPRPVSITD